MSVSPNDLAREIIDVVPLVMRELRSEMRSNRGPGLSVPHFRALGYLNGHEGASLSELAEYVGLRLPSMSTLVDGMVERGLVTRSASEQDRRRLTLCLTARGQSTLAAARRAAQARLEAILTGLAPDEQDAVYAAMHLLRPLFVARPETGADTRGA
jgi:DNA-binding MarR family transcriptional regulator